ncbi:hypothetical protein DSM106972_015770 [Dulcicalothrix desertica PCC 7102]|uniref:Uncharacterized protein n=1 Tax=Dulcicalothrix desertica PCC 7102 TaxID=232991 RepID=A0A433VQP5_9CYAN|nr:hypothetical protein [Dulcicalothrix desertica]RUT08409.1 hypothetical protein DSM106972_015770 [Dulcicalothrix desertica PCC 7102]
MRIISKSVELPQYTETSLSLVEITKNSSSIKGVRKLSCSNVEKTLLCRFNVPFDLLKNPKLSFVYTIDITSVINGRVVRHPSANFLYFNLKDISST